MGLVREAHLVTLPGALSEVEGAVHCCVVAAALLFIPLVVDYRCHGALALLLPSISAETPLASVVSLTADGLLLSRTLERAQLPPPSHLRPGSVQIPLARSLARLCCVCVFVTTCSSRLLQAHRSPLYRASAMASASCLKRPCVTMHVIHAYTAGNEPYE